MRRSSIASARRIAARTGLRSAFDDLWSAGALGLLEAAPRFDAARGVSFETFVEHRIRGAMLDELRKMDHLPRRLRSRTDDVQKVKQKLAGQLGREATTEEVAQAMNVDLEELSGLEALLEPHVPLDKATHALVSGEGSSGDGIEEKIERAAAGQGAGRGVQEAAGAAAGGDGPALRRGADLPRDREDARRQRATRVPAARRRPQAAAGDGARVSDRGGGA